jgi:hypothetical protein
MSIYTEAAKRGYPTSSERKRWTEHDWDAYNIERGKVVQAEWANEELKQNHDPARLHERITSLEADVAYLREAVRLLDVGAGVT